MIKVKEYALWMQELVTQAFHGGFSREVHCVAYCEESKMVCYVATLHAKGTAEEMRTDYTYLVKLDDNDGKVVSVRKIWNDFYALQKAGWLQATKKVEEGHYYD
jgi:hypothetical protein